MLCVGFKRTAFLFFQERKIKTMSQYITAEQFAERFQLSLQRAYELAREVLPPGVVFRFGRQIRINEHKLNEWIENGGSLGALRKNAKERTL